MLDLLLHSPIAWLLIGVTLLLHALAFLWVRSQIRKARVQSQVDRKESGQRMPSDGD